MNVREVIVKNPGQFSEEEEKVVLGKSLPKITNLPQNKSQNEDNQYIQELIWENSSMLNQPDFPRKHIWKYFLVMVLKLQLDQG